MQLHEIVEGSLDCESCHEVFPIIRSIPRFVSSDAYSKSFSFQWNLFATTQLDSGRDIQTRNTFIEKTGITPEELRGRVVLEAGCGMGRFLHLLSKQRETTIVGFDLSLAVEAAYRNVGHMSNVHILQADIFHLPFAKSTFDFIFSIGVLHHTPNPKRAFVSLVPLLKRRGEVAIWVYAKYRRPPLSDFYRIFTSRMPWSMTLALCRLLAELYPLHRKFRHLRVILPISMLEDRERRLLDTFDWYSPRYQSKSTWQDVIRWFREAEFSEIRTLPFPISVRGRKGPMVPRKR